MRGAGCAEGPRKNWGPSPLDTAAGCAPGAAVPLLTDHRLGYWLQWENTGESKVERRPRTARQDGDQTPKALLRGPGGGGAFQTRCFPSIKLHRGV